MFSELDLSYKWESNPDIVASSYLLEEYTDRSGVQDHLQLHSEFRNALALWTSPLKIKKRGKEAMKWVRRILVFYEEEELKSMLKNLFQLHTV